MGINTVPLILMGINGEINTKSRDIITAKSEDIINPH